MILSTELTQEEASNFFLSDPKLVLLGLSDEEICELHKTNQYELQPDIHYITVRENDKILALVKYEYFSSVTISYHMYVASSEQDKSEMYAEMIPMLKNYIANELDIHKLIIIVPSTCLHTQAFALKAGYKEEGRLKNSFVWRQQIVDLIIYGGEDN